MFFLNKTKVFDIFQDDFFEHDFQCMMDVGHSTIRESFSKSRTTFLLGNTLHARFVSLVEDMVPQLLSCLHQIFPLTALERVSISFVLFLLTRIKPTHLNCNVHSLSWKWL